MSSVQALSASPGRGRHPLPPWQWVLSGRLPACDLTFPTCKRKVKSPARNGSAGPQAQSQSSGMAVSFLSRTSNTSSISGILSLANNRTSYLTGTQVGPFTRLEVREPELGREEVSTLLPSSTGFGLRGSDVLCQLLNSAVTTRAQTDRVWVKARAAFRHDRPRGQTAGCGRRTLGRRVSCSQDGFPPGPTALCVPVPCPGGQHGTAAPTSPSTEEEPGGRGEGCLCRPRLRREEDVSEKPQRPSWKQPQARPGRVSLAASLGGRDEGQGGMAVGSAASALGLTECSRDWAFTRLWGEGRACSDSSLDASGGDSGADGAQSGKEATQPTSLLL